MTMTMIGTEDRTAPRLTLRRRQISRKSVRRVGVEPGPRHGIIDGESPCLAASFEPGAEQADLPFEVVELEPERPAQLQVLVESFTQCRHRGTCPNGTTSSRSDARSTFGGRPDWALRRLGFSSGHRFGGQNLERLLGVQVAPMGMLIFWLVFNVAIAALFGYVGSVPRHEAAGLVVTLGVSAESGCSV